MGVIWNYTLLNFFGLFLFISPSNKSNESISDNLGIEGVLESVPHLPWWCIDDIPCTCP